MKIVQINTVYEYSSTGRTTMEMHQYLKSHGEDSYVFCVNVDRPSEKIYKFSGKFDMTFHSVMSRLLGLQGYFSYLSTKRLIKRIEKISPDIVHLRVLHSNCINLRLILTFLAEKDIPTVITLHDCWYFTGHCCYFLDVRCDKWKYNCGKCPEISNWNTSWFFDQSSKHLHAKKELFGNIRRLAVVGVSDWVTDFIQYSILKNSKIIRRIYNWVDISKYSGIDGLLARKKYDISENDFVVLGVAQNWFPTKGLDDIISLARMNKDVKFCVVGNIMEKKLPENVFAVGVLSNEKELICCYSMADVFFNPSKQETFGKVTIEALASGTPAVVYNMAASPELIKEGCGFVVEPGDLKTASKKILQIRKEGKKKYSNNCKDFVRNNFNIDKLMSENINLYKQLLAE